MNMLGIVFSALLQSSQQVNQQQIDRLLDSAWQPSVVDSFIVNREGVLYAQGVITGIPIAECRVSVNVVANYGAEKEVVLVDQRGWSEIGGGNDSRFSVKIGSVARSIPNEITVILSFRFSVTQPYRSGEQEFSIVKDRVIELPQDSLRSLLKNRKEEVRFLR